MKRPLVKFDINQLWEHFRNNVNNIEELEKIRYELTFRTKKKFVKKVESEVRFQLIVLKVKKILESPELLRLSKKIKEQIHDENLNQNIYEDPNVPYGIEFTKTDNLLHFTRLDSSPREISVYTLGWRFSETPDVWSNIVMGFKYGGEESIVIMKTILVPITEMILKQNSIESSSTGILTAISHHKIGSEPNDPLYKLGSHIESKLGIKFLQNNLRKKSHLSLRRTPGRENRAKMVHGVYECEKFNNIQNVIVLDDIVTMGSTMKDIRRAIWTENKDIRIIGLALAKHERNKNCSKYSETLSNKHLKVLFEQIIEKLKLSI